MSQAPLTLDVELSDLHPGDRITGDSLVRGGRITVRRLSEHAYWIESGGYLSTVVLGAASALLFDPQSGGRGLAVRDVVRKVFDLEVTALAYSHAHRDHCADAQLLVADADEFQRYAGAACAARLARLDGVPPATQVLADGEIFDFDGVAIELRVVGGHTPDLCWYRLPEEGVLHLPDVVHPGQIEFDSFGMAPDLGDYRAALEQVAGAHWRVLTAGHGQLGWPADVELVLDYLGDLYRVVAAAVAEHPPAGFVRGRAHSYRWIDDRVRTVQAYALARLETRWGLVPGFDVAGASHVKRVFWDIAYFA